MAQKYIVLFGILIDTLAYFGRYSPNFEFHLHTNDYLQSFKVNPIVYTRCYSSLIRDRDQTAVLRVMIGPQQFLDQSAYRPAHGLYGRLAWVTSCLTYGYCLRNRLGDKSRICSVGKGTQTLY